MAGMGPPPNKNARRRNAQVPMVQLPADGRKGPVPDWPLVGEAFPQELELWSELWGLPQAAVWERLRYGREVAQYVRWKILAEEGDLNAAKEARQLSDRLGLTPLALLRLRWEVSGDDEVGDKRDEKERPRRRLSEAS